MANEREIKLQRLNLLIAENLPLYWPNLYIKNSVKGKKAKGVSCTDF